MKITPTDLPDVLVIEPDLHGDERGFFSETFNARVFADATGYSGGFVQDNQSRSAKGVLRGLHFQVHQPQGKLVRVARGAIFDVAVDMRRSSPFFGKWTGVEISEENYRQLWVPAGFAHGLYVLRDQTDVLYKTSDYYAPGDECCIKWDDATIGVEWPLDGTPILSAKDQLGIPFADAPAFDGFFG